MANVKKRSATRAATTAAATTTNAAPRPPFIISSSDVEETERSYTGSKELLAAGRAIGQAAGMLRIGLHLKRVAPGRRTSWPHAESSEEEFVYVIAGAIDCWVDGNVHRMNAGDLAAFPAGTGIAHTFINNSNADALLLVGGEANKCDNKIVYPLHPERAAALRWSEYWHDAPLKLLGEHDALPDAADASARTARRPRRTPPKPRKARPQINVVVKSTGKGTSKSKRKARS